MTCICGHNSYWSEFADGRLTHCFGCHQTFPSVGQGALESGRMVVDRPSEPFVLPPESRPLRTTDWLERWPAITPELAKRYGWYVAELVGYEHLVMPITRNGQAIFYSARALDNKAPKKYHYPPGATREYWLSDDTLRQDAVFICEGVADAVALSLYASSVALLGTYYDGRLHSLLAGKKVLIAFDGDFQGRMAAVQVAHKIKTARSVKLSIIDGKDPSEWTRGEAEGSYHD